MIEAQQVAAAYAQSGASSSLQVSVALFVGTASVAAFLYRQWRSGPKELPKDGVFDLKTLAHFDGVRLPLCMGVCGKVIDCSGSENIKAGEGYGKIWAGKDATYALATLSLKPEHANTLDFTLDQFTAEQHKALAGWYKHFTTKYKVVGELVEYKGWDFSSVEKEAESQTPFGLKAPGAGKEAEEKSEEKPAAPAPKQEMLLRAGDRVVIRGDEERPELNGRAGTLVRFNPSAKGFEVTLEGDSEPTVFKPTHLTKPQNAESG